MRDFGYYALKALGFLGLALLPTVASAMVFQMGLGFLGYLKIFSAELAFSHRAQVLSFLVGCTIGVSCWVHWIKTVVVEE